MAQTTFDGQVWAPSAFTPPLSKDFPSDGYRLIELVEKHWKTQDGRLVVLDDWQKSLLVHLLERFPTDHPNPLLAGRLRYRQAVVSMGRQNGKSLLGGILALWGLLQHVKGPSVIGVASSREQANVIYDRAKYAVTSSPALKQRLKATGTRGIGHRDGSGSYTVKPSLSDSLQGIPITLGIADELHVSDAEVWNSIVNGQRAQPNGLLIGITTAGDDSSLLLKQLYANGQAAIQNPGGEGRFGFFLWEAPEGSTIDTPGAIEAANPAVACGRLPIDTVRSDVRLLPVQDQERFTLNRFVASISSWLPMAAWKDCAKGGLPGGPRRGLTWSIAKTPSWEHASIQVSAKVGGVVYTELVASIANPNLEQLENLCQRLFAQHGGRFVVSSRSLGALGISLKDKGYEVYKLVDTEIQQGCSMAYSKILTGTMSHPDDDLLQFQMPLAKRKNVGDSWTLTGSDNPLGVDAVLGMVMGLYVAETHPPPAPMI